MHIEDYIKVILKNKFMPIPDSKRIFTGNDGDIEDFRLQGCNTLRSLVTHGLKPEHKILDIGSGIGRVALPLTFYLDQGEYYGIDIVLDGVSWCREFITSKYKNFTFLHSDIYNEYYNKMGVHSVQDMKLPFKSESFDFIFASSVFTHLFLEDTLSYLEKSMNLLKSGGRFWSTWFLIDDKIKKAIRKNKADLQFQIEKDSIIYTLPDRESVAVAYDKEYINQQFLKFGFKIIDLNHGVWSSVYTNGGFQDLISAEKI